MFQIGKIKKLTIQNKTSVSLSRICKSGGINNNDEYRQLEKLNYHSVYSRYVIDYRHGLIDNEHTLVIYLGEWFLEEVPLEAENTILNLMLKHQLPIILLTKK